MDSRSNSDCSCLKHIYNGESIMCCLVCNEECLSESLDDDSEEIIYGMMLSNHTNNAPRQRLSKLNRNSVNDILSRWETELSMIGGAELVTPLYNPQPQIDEVQIRTLLTAQGQNVIIPITEAVLRHDRPSGIGYKILEKQEREIEKYKSNNQKIWS